MGQGCLALEKAIKEASNVHTEWGLEGTLRSNAVFACQMKQVDATYFTAKQAVITTAGVNCLSRMQGATRLQQRDKLLQQKQLMPMAFQQLLEKLK